MLWRRLLPLTIAVMHFVSDRSATWSATSVQSATLRRPMNVSEETNFIINCWTQRKSLVTFAETMPWKFMTCRSWGHFGNKKRPQEAHDVKTTSHRQRCNVITSHRLWYGPHREKTCLRCFRQSEIQTSLLSYSDYLENWKFTRSNFTYATLQKANNKGADQTARLRRLVCACVVRNPPPPPPEDRFSRNDAHMTLYKGCVPAGAVFLHFWQVTEHYYD